MTFLDRAFEAERVADLRRYLEDQLASVIARRKQPQTRDEHARLADLEAHYRKLLGKVTQ